jgi:hypothetical protein
MLLLALLVLLLQALLGTCCGLQTAHQTDLPWQLLVLLLPRQH